ncbi:hypothetical protein M409DRAFT_53354 [Zasmidium cellare ATCC 36951]|uniref:Uncharacterized protein n=1 Tax=Zasmidium cellare ATCC 36951 TaxID=1080233 RepID=A0A6A6CPG2_ZASCE|nr:uncharacterized protein M409DRAFT_53354 [Zasmidium cellare ATCC 36951]KAF2168020.1 hypothetical protein M409DRAFT_53354 [Zasmidium cellare ATCC 36951]
MCVGAAGRKGGGGEGVWNAVEVVKQQGGMVGRLLLMIGTAHQADPASGQRTHGREAVGSSQSVIAGVVRANKATRSEEQNCRQRTGLMPARHRQTNELDDDE